MAFFKINGISVKTPMTVTWGLSDISSEDSGRTRDGAMHKDVVTQKRTLKVRWGDMDWSEAVIISRFCKRAGVQVTLTFPDIMEGTIISKSFYTGDIEAPYRMWTNQAQRVQYINCDFIEI